MTNFKTWKIGKIMNKVISVVLAVSLVFCFSICGPKQAFADDASGGQQKTNDFFLKKAIKSDGITVGGVDSVLYGNVGTIYEGEECYSYYSIEPKCPVDSNGNKVYFNKNGGYWNSNGKILNLINKRSIIEDLTKQYINCIDKCSKDESFLSSVVENFANLDAEDFLFDARPDWNNAIGAFIFGAFAAMGAWAIVVFETGVTAAGGAAAGGAAAVGAAAGGPIGFWVFLAAVIVGGTIFAAIYEDDVVKPEIDKVGFNNKGKGLINIGSINNWDNGLDIIFTNDNKLVGWEFANYFKGDNTVSIKDNSKVDKIIIIAGNTAFDPEEYYNWLKTNCIDKIDKAKDNFNKELISYVNKGLSNALNKDTIKHKITDQFEAYKVDDVVQFGEEWTIKTYNSYFKAMMEPVVNNIKFSKLCGEFTKNLFNDDTMQTYNNTMTQYYDFYLKANDILNSELDQNSANMAIFKLADNFLNGV